MVPAAKFLTLMDTTVDPCVDFYRFSCGNFLNTTTIPDDEGSANQFKAVDDDLKEKLNSLLKQPASPTELAPFVGVRNFYASCMNKGKKKKKKAI
jgi:predicted metalloendopeptidase